MSTNSDLEARYPRIANPMEAIDFALELPWADLVDFLQTWRDGAWNVIEEAYPEYLKGLEEGK